MADLVLVTRPDDGILLLTLNRPEKRNALSKALLAALADALDLARDQDSVRCAVITGGPKQFSAGADIGEMMARGVDAIDDPGRQGAWRRIEGFPKPLIAAVEGYAFGGGHELAMVADYIVAARDARFGQPEINLGILPGDGATQRIPRAGGKALAMRMMLTGQPIGAEDAFRAGLVAVLTEPGAAVQASLEDAALIAGRNPIGAALAKQAVQDAFELPLAAGLAAERRAIRLAFAKGAHEDGMAAFLNKGKTKAKDQTTT